MTKPTDETWTNEIVGCPDEVWLDGIGPIFEPHGERAKVDRGDDIARARLAAQAPRMARLLLKFDREGGVDGGDYAPVCPECGHSGMAADGVHACELVSVLRDAGMIE